MDGVKVPYEREVDLMEYVGPLYKYGDWMILIRYLKSMHKYKLFTNYKR